MLSKWNLYLKKILFIATFKCVSILALLFSAIPQPIHNAALEVKQTLWQEFVFGVHYIQKRPAFLYLMGFVTITMFLMPGMGYTLVTPPA